MAWGQAPDGTVPIVARATTDSRGRYELPAPALAWRPPQRLAPSVCADRVGLGLAACVTRLKKADAGEYRLVLNAAGRRTFTLRGGDGRPASTLLIAGLSRQSDAPNDPGGD